ncbi:NDR1/HIN1-like protein 6 [Rutidosis leptorrhynchoides]|uniref:NDR1/HIN1-like protein 6 n=1 Tax=Rutidosis leptorrhynchoides TaxID=125765 RepID=UPI003A98DE03
MADHQKIHPAPVQPEHDLESQQKPSAPLVPEGSSKSDTTHPIEPFPPHQRTIPVHYSKPPKRRSCCAQLLCWLLFLIIVLIICVGILAAIVYFGFDPKIPKYSVDGLTITRFGLDNDTSLYAQFNVNITARNPNSKIGIYYENGSKLSVSYMGTNLCEGSLPKFYQGHKNTTVLDVALTGQTRDAGGLMNSLLAQQQTGSVPLVLRVRVPVKIKLGNLKLPKWKPVVRCKLDVNSLSTDNVIRIRDSSCSFKFKL